MGYHTNTGLRPKALYMIQDTTTNGANAGRMLEDESSTGKKRPWRKQKMGSRGAADEEIRQAVGEREVFWKA